ncbi:hypothetical protein HZA97_04745 [Candidatus Woesearchaeota archaeon]|nr:hypothetical protein [Candidatus Woesearchaeota archaeon]
MTEQNIKNNKLLRDSLFNLVALPFCGISTGFCATAAMYKSMYQESYTLPLALSIVYGTITVLGVVKSYYNIKRFVNVQEGNKEVKTQNTKKGPIDPWCKLEDKVQTLQ